VRSRVSKKVVGKTWSLPRVERCGWVAPRRLGRGTGVAARLCWGRGETQCDDALRTLDAA
jgi:hypothetical protein